MPVPRGSLADSNATREALLDAAEELIATHGIDGASMRAIHRRAGLALGAVGYHFGSKEDLVDALVAREQAGLGRQIGEHAARLAARPQAPTAREIVEAVAAPYVRFILDDPVRGPRQVNILAHAIRDGGERTARLLGQTRVLFPELIGRAYPGVSAEQARAAMAVAAQSLLLLLALASGRVEPPAAGQVPAEFDVIVTFVAGGLDALLRRNG